jgi:hypothetical protein
MRHEVEILAGLVEQRPPSILVRYRASGFGPCEKRSRQASTGAMNGTSSAWATSCPPTRLWPWLSW